MGNSGTIISLSDPVGIIQQGFLDYVSKLINTRNSSIGNYGHALNYNYAPYLQQLILDIFDDHTLTYDNDRYIISTIPSCTRILIKDGLDEKYAIDLSISVCQLIVDTIVAWVPTVNFNEDGYRFSLIEDYDLFITVPYLDNRD